MAEKLPYNFEATKKYFKKIFFLGHIMFDKIEYKLLISGYMTKDEYKNLINKYMDEFNISYITAKQYISRKQKKQFEQENNIKYDQALIDTYNDIVENGYNISML